MIKVLSIDGGGIRGLIPAMLLAEIERQTGRPIVDTFDLIAGTSTGGILALGLCRDGGNGRPKYTAQQLVELYQNRGGEIFSRTLWQKIVSLNGWRDQTYSHKPLEKILLEYFGNATLGQALKPVLITSYDIGECEPYFFKSWRPDRKGVEMRLAARATSAAPTYFEPAPVTVAGKTRYLVDGGVFVNNPAMCAHASARRKFKKEAEELLVLSLGTGALGKSYSYEEARGWGKAKWLAPVMNIMFDGVSDAVAYQLTDILDKRFVRIQSKLEPKKDAMDDARPDSIRYLMGLARETIRSQQREIAALCARLGPAGAAGAAAKRPAPRARRKPTARPQARRR